MDSIASQITSLTIVYSTVHSGTDQRTHQSSASLAFVWEIHRWPVNFPHKWPVTRKMFPFDDVIMFTGYTVNNGWTCALAVLCEPQHVWLHTAYTQVRKYSPKLLANPHNSGSWYCLYKCDYAQSYSGNSQDFFLGHTAVWLSRWVKYKPKWYM